MCPFWWKKISGQSVSSAAGPGISRPSAPPPSLCVICKQEGHASAYCPTRGKHLHLQVMGSAIPGEGFFCMEFEEEEEVEGSDLKAANGAILTMEPGRLSLRTLKQELKHMVASDWDWQIAQVGDNNFAVVFVTSPASHYSNLPLMKVMSS